MKRLLPILGIFLITTLLGCSQNSQREKEKPLEEKNTLSRDVPDLYPITNDFENSTTWNLWFTSKNKMLFDSSMAMINPMLERSVRNGEKSYAYLKLTCKKYADNYRYTFR